MDELLEAIRHGNAARVAEILDADPSLLDGPGLLQALYRNRRDVAQLFLDRGHRLTYFEAAAFGDVARAGELLDADPSLLDAFGDDGFNALGLAIFFQHPEIARLLIDRGADVVAPARNAMKVAPVHAAATQGDREMMRLLLERGADPNARQQSDYTPLHSSAGRGDHETARLLVSKGADARAKAADGKTPADIARERGFNELAAWLDNA
ncbi:MAG TPA: ankyrin repeat domain-containing protein [Thermoanaerobaculia bacterium]|nr:ankyrin repeat domain-containing protein [Thermoanaerobaculia bacterium]